MAKDTKNNKEIKTKKHFFKDFKAELKKVIWPTPKQIVNNTIAVITIVIIAAAIVFVLDLVFDILNDKGINRIKSNIKSKTAVESVIEDNAENQEEGSTDETEQNETESDDTNVNSVDENEPSEENAE